MIDTLINENWSYSKLGANDFHKISLPHDAMIYEERDFSSKGGKNISYFTGYNYEYKKEIFINDIQKKIYYLYFEGIYKDAEIYVNNQLVHKENYGYNSFLVDISEFVCKGKNLLSVKCFNADQPNSRWYSGSGIYRNVHLFICEEKHIKPFGVKFTGNVEGAFKLSLSVTGKGIANVSLFEDNRAIYNKELLIENEGTICDCILNAKQWNIDTPYLYKLVVSFGNDNYETNVGFRSIELDKNKGLLINKKRTLLLGACIHHDNGLLGACDDELSSYRKILLLKKAGYNAIRSAHNPLSINMLNACDKLGMLVLDEYVDCWFMHKTIYDYASHVEQNFDSDIQLMVNKDYNHPSVILYSSGNEVGESFSKKGIELTRKLTECFHKFDNTRPVTCGINIFFNFLSRIGVGVYSDKKALKELNKKPTKRKKSVGSEFFNDLAGKCGANFMKKCASLKVCDLATRGTFENVDIAGYNYGINRYKKDIKNYQDRFILGTETFCSDAGIFYELAKKNPRIIGDFVWAGFDYIGEVGVGSWTCEEYCDNDFSHQLGWLTAGSGRIEITGRFNSEVDYTQVCFEQRKIAIGVIPVHHYRSKHSASCWKYSRAYPIYNYPRYEGKDTEVEVYSKCSRVELYINNSLCGDKKVGKNYLTRFKIKYYPGTIKAIAYDKNNKIIDSSSLTSGDGECFVKCEVEDNCISSPLRYVHFKIQNSQGTVPCITSDLEITKLENASLIGLGNGCTYTKYSYKGNKTFFHYGEALAIVKITNLPAKITYLTKFGKESLEILQ